MDIEALCRETALHLFGDLRSEAAIQAGIGQVRPTVEFVVARVRAEAVAAEGDREALGRAVREEWMAWAQEQPSPKPSWLVPWDELAEPDREVDRRIGERLYGLGRAEAVADERRGIGAMIGALPNHAECAMNTQFRFGWNNAKATILEALAAGSVPVANPGPDPTAEALAEGPGRIADQWADIIAATSGPVATPTRPHDTAEGGAPR
jgi:hypothetical protein